MMVRWTYWLTPVPVLVSVLIGFEAYAQTPVCDALSGEARSVARYLLSSEHPYDCCDGTIEKCVRTRPDCPLAVRLADFVCRRAAGGQDRATIQRSLQKRALSMMRPGRIRKMDLSNSLSAGNESAKVRAVAYACTRCPFCSKLIPELYREVTSGRLAGKVAFHVRLFPVKSHDHSTEANLAAVAASSLGRPWEFLLIMLENFDGFAVDKLAAWAVQAGLDREAFEKARGSTSVRRILVAAKKEGLRNGVEATPALFINGRKYAGDLDTDTLVDVLEEEAEAVQ